MIDDEMLSLKEMRKFLNLKNLSSDIAKETGLSYQTIDRIRQEKGNYNTGTLKLLSMYIKKQLDSLKD